MDQFALGANECLGITKTTTRLKILGQPDEFEVAGGEIIKILRLVSLGGCFIKLYSTENRNLILSDQTYSCDHNAIKILSEKLCSMLITIGDRVKRLMICNNSENERFLMNLKLNDLVKVNKYLFKRDHHVVCTVKYIGPVSEIGPGIYIGCTLFDENDTIDEKTKLASKYFNCNEANGFIRNCGCFFTRTMLLDQSIDNLMNIVKAAKRNNAHKPKRVVSVPETNSVPTETYILNKTTTSTVEPQATIRNTITVTNYPSLNNQIPPQTTHNYSETRTSSTTSPSANKIPQQNIFKSATVYPETKPTSVYSSNNVNNYTETRTLPTASTSSSANKIPQQNIFKSANVYPETKPPSVYSSNNVNNYTETRTLPTASTSSSANKIPQQNIFKSANVYPETKPTSVYSSNNVNNYTETRTLSTASTSSSANKIPQQNIFKSANIYPETKPTSVYSSNYATGYNTANDRSSLYWTPTNLNLNTNKPPPPPPKKDRCSVM